MSSSNQISSDMEKSKKFDSMVIEDNSSNDTSIESRGNWSGKFDFLLSLLGYAIGLGNVWRFPYLCFKHGGGAFLIPYFLMLFFIGIPCFFLEISIGQYAALGPITLYNNLSPLFKGLGFANFYVSILVALYYNMIIAWTIYYTFASFTSDLPWSGCGQDFNSDFCFSITDYKNCTAWRANDSSYGGLIYHRGKCTNDPDDLKTIRENLTYFYKCTLKDLVSGDKIGDGVYVNDTDCVNKSRINELTNLFDIPRELRITSAQEYYQRSVLNESSGIDNMGPVEWHLALSLLAAWVIIFLCLVKGIHSSGKVVYFTAIFPVVVLMILLFRAVTLPGAYLGIQFYIIPDFSKLGDVKVWEAAAVQIFFSLSIAGGGLTTLASYNRFDNKIIRDTMLVCFGTSIMSVIAGFAVFSILGFMADELGVDVKDVVQDGSGLAFIAYPDLVTRLPVSPFWAVLFFLMLFTLGLDSQFAIVETILTGVLDWNPNWRRFKTVVIAIICTLGFIIGLPLATGGGGYLLDLMDYYAAGWPYLFIGLCELIIMSYVYGLERWLADIKQMVNFKPGLWFKSHFNFVYFTLSPAIILLILIISWADHEPLKKGSYEYPMWADAVGWIMAMIAILSVPVVAIYQVLYKVLVEFKDIESIRKRFSLAFDVLLPATDTWRKNEFDYFSKLKGQEPAINGHNNRALASSEDSLNLTI